MGECFYLLLLVLFFGEKEKSCKAEAVTGTRSQKAGCPKGTMAAAPWPWGAMRRFKQRGERLLWVFNDRLVAVWTWLGLAETAKDPLQRASLRPAQATGTDLRSW